MDVSAFFDIPENERHCVHAATEEEAKIVMGWFIDQGRPNWRSVNGDSRSENTKWHYYKENTVYYPEGTYGSVQYAETCHNTIYEVSDFTTSKIEWNEVFANG